ncbi:MAG: hypothetical protein ACOX47_10950 [Bacillota bacterium]|jgi:hypothetical protein
MKKRNHHLMSQWPKTDLRQVIKMVSQLPIVIQTYVKTVNTVTDVRQATKEQLCGLLLQQGNNCGSS